MYAIEEYDKALEKAGEFLRTQQNPDGSVKGIELDTFWGYYSQPLALLGTGSSKDWNSANRCIDYIKSKFLDSDGSLKVVTETRWKEKIVAGDLYAASYLIRGASLRERFDVASPAVKYLLRFQDKESGGIFYRIENRRFIDPSVTANGGIGMILTGHLKEAEMAGQFFVRLHTLQPNLEEGYLTIWDAKEKKLLTGSENLNDVPDSTLTPENKNNVNAYWDAGYIMVFMTYLYHIAGNKRYLRVAQELFDAVSNYKGFKLHVWKTPWACARLYQTTREQKYLDVAITMANRIVSLQQSDGGFCPEDWSSYSILQSDMVQLIDITSQLTYFLSEVRAVL